MTPANNSPKEELTPMTTLQGGENLAASVAKTEFDE